MGDILSTMLKNFLEASNIQFEKGPNSTTFTINSSDGISKTSLYNILPYMHLIFFDIHASSLPGEIAENASFHPLQFNYCVGGRIELLLDDNSYIYLQENDFCISRQTSQNESFFPTKYYHGITIYFDPDFFTDANKELTSLFNLDLHLLSELYFDKRDTYIADSSDKMKLVLKRLWQLNDTPSVFDMKISVLQLLHLLLDKTTVSPEKTLTFYTKVQVEIAKKAEQLLTMDLKEHIPIKEIAIQLNVSETSLKNYFRGVYGKNISDYLRDLRMEYAKKLLRETKLPISEIAYMTGYTKQGKFAEVFREKFQLKPLEFRRTYNLNKPITKE